jgi:hypothetical protein
MWFLIVEFWEGEQGGGAARRITREERRQKIDAWGYGTVVFGPAGVSVHPYQPMPESLYCMQGQGPKESTVVHIAMLYRHGPVRPSTRETSRRAVAHLQKYL